VGTGQAVAPGVSRLHRDIKVAALDADWSGLKVVWRRERRTTS
jgi:hypothetical protein